MKVSAIRNQVRMLAASAGNALPAACATSTQDQPGEDGNVLQRRDGCLAAGACRSRHRQVKGFSRLRRRSSLGVLRTLLSPLPLEHDRQTIDDHVQKAADREPDQYRGGKAERR